MQKRHVRRCHFEILRNQPIPSDNAIGTWINNIEQTESINKKREGGTRTIQNPENIKRVRPDDAKNPR